ncbi:LOW QUALITY PROTEIN: hypothetical protein PHMEG_00017560 [Phytophthora megakarya]|uniref:Uncharacterized protein n=1 Tax=Phytophthora megakarya TaxID=4795 RepID=A0A225VY55_9STRA|nr:LOW QUALITY PROTEIN: hypothetical protein PHMEG_00017560 [Phytophthora megakarya]
MRFLEGTPEPTTAVGSGSAPVPNATSQVVRVPGLGSSFVMSQEPTDAPHPRGSRGPTSHGAARGRAGLGGCPRPEAPTSRHLALTGTDTGIPAPSSSTTIPNSGDADDIPAPLSLTTIPRSNRAAEPETGLDEDLPAPNAVGSRELTTVGSPRPVVPLALSRNAGTRPSETPDTLAVRLSTARAVEPSTVLSASFWNADADPVSALTARSAGQPVAAKPTGVGDTALTTRRPLGPSATQTPSLRLHPTVAASLRTLQDSTRETTLAAQQRHSAAQVCQYVAAQVHRWMSRGSGVVPPPDPYYPDRHHRPMRKWLLEKKYTVRHLREIASVGRGDLGPPTSGANASAYPWLPPHSYFRRIWKNYVSPTTMLHDAGYTFLNSVPTWGRTLSPELLTAQDGQFMSDASFLWGLLTVEQVVWNEIARGRQYSVRRDDASFQTLDPEVASPFPDEEDGDTLILTIEEQELLGAAMVTRLKLHTCTPRTGPNPTRVDQSQSDAMEAPMRRYLCPRGLVCARPLGSGEGLLRKSSGTSSLASGDASMLTPDENMSSAGGGSQGPPGMESSTAMVEVYIGTTGSGTGQRYTAEQPTLYVPVAEHPPGQDARLPPCAPTPTPPPTRGDGLGGSEDETKSDDRSGAASP